MKKLALSLCTVLLNLLMLLSCSGDDGAGVMVDNPQQEEQDEDNGGEMGMDEAPMFSGFDLEFSGGDFWEYYWITEEINVAQGSASARTDNGRFRVTLGEPRDIAGITSYGLEITGANLEAYAGPRWAYIAARDNVVLGSMDGNTLDTIFNPRDGEWAGGGFFANFDDAARINANEGTIENEFIATNAVTASYQDGQEICEIIAGERICANDNAFRITVDDYFKAGLGPVGYNFSQTSFDQGGGFTTSSEFYFEIGLVSTSFTANDGFVPTLPAWQEKTTLPEPFILTTVVPWEGKLYVLGGYDTDFNSTTQIYTYDPEADVWETLGNTPMELAFRYEENGSFRPVAYEALVVNDKIYCIRTEGPETNNILIFDPVTNIWETGPDIGGLKGQACYLTVTGDAIYFFPIDPNRVGSVSILNTADNTWSTGNSSPWSHLSRSTVSALGDKIYFSGTFRSGVFESRVRVYDTSVPVGTNGAWSDTFFTGEGRADAASQVLNGRLYVMGGDNFGPVLRDVEEYDPAQNSWKTVSSMLSARAGFLSVTLNDKIYAVGSGIAQNFTIEEYDPARDWRSQ